MELLDKDVTGYVPCFMSDLQKVNMFDFLFKSVGKLMVLNGFYRV